MARTIKELEQDLIALKEITDREKGDLHEKIRDRQAEIKNITKQLDKKEQELKDVEVKLTEKMSMAEAEWSLKEADLLREFDKTKHEQEVNATRLKDDVGGLQVQLKEDEKDYRNQLGMKDNEINTLKQKMNDDGMNAKKMYSDKEDELKFAKSRIEEMTTEMDKLKAEYTLMQADIEWERKDKENEADKFRQNLNNERAQWDQNAKVLEKEVFNLKNVIEDNKHKAQLEIKEKEEVIRERDNRLEKERAERERILKESEETKGVIMS